MADLLDHMDNPAPSADGALNGQKLNYTSGISTPDGGEGAAIQPTHVVCPWCWEPLVETRNGDGRLLGISYVQRTYRCEPCELTLFAKQDPRPL